LSKIRDGAQKKVRLDCGVLGAYDAFFCSVEEVIRIRRFPAELSGISPCEFKNPDSSFSDVLAISIFVHSFASLRSVFVQVPRRPSRWRGSSGLNHSTHERNFRMLIVAIMFLGLWIAGLATSYTMGGFIHVLLVLAITVMFSHFIRGSRPSRLAEFRAVDSQKMQGSTK
jgi:hypothetical protein